MGIIDYNRYLRKDSPFFEEPFSGKQHFFELPFLDDDDRYTTTQNDVWKEYSTKDKLPEQGWKIHVCSSELNCAEVLCTTAKICSKENVTFKFLKSREVFFAQHAKYADRPQAGKFITIYPYDDNEFIRLLGILSNVLRGISAPPILTDVNVPGTPVFFRYGGFRMMEVTNSQGIRVPAIKNDKGDLVPDIRTTQFVMPSFVRPPDDIEKLVQDSRNPKDDLLTNLIKGYKVESALHFSNAGGIYLLKELDSGRSVVMKEGRSLLGVDGALTDGERRIEHEYSVLQALSDIDGIVKPIKLTHSGDNAYLFEEFVEGSTLFSWQSQNYPFDMHKDTSEYETKAIQIIHSFYALMKKVHESGICLCDFQPRNIIIGKDLSVTLIDMESSSDSADPDLPSMGTPGFIPHTKCSPEEVDNYSLMQTAMHLFVPVVPIQGLTDSYWDCEIRFVKNNFSEKAVTLLESLRHSIPVNILQHKTAVTSSTPDFPIFNNLNQLRNDLISGLQNSRRDKNPLYHADIIQYDSEQALFDIENGLAGVMYALGAKDKNAAKDLEILNHSAENCHFSDYGLYRGALGIACVLAERGKPEAVDKIMKRFLEIGPANNNIAIRSGLAGQYLALRRIRQFDHGEIVDRAYKAVLTSLCSYDRERLQSTKLTGISNEKGSGLLDGYSGMAVALSLAASDLHSSSLKEQANDALNMELEALEISSNGSAHVLDENRLLPYLAEGSGGIAIAILQVDPELKDSNNKAFLRRILKACDVRLSIYGGLFYGYSGLLGISAQCISDSTASEIMKRFDTLSLYLFDDVKGDRLFVGSGGQAMSCGYSDGAAGVLALLNFLTFHADSWVFGIPARLRSRGLERKLMTQHPEVMV